MNNIKKIKLVHETPNHFIMHDGNSHFHVAKKGLDQEMVKKIQGFSGGGEVDSMLSNLGEKITKAFEKKPASKPAAPQESLEDKNNRIRKENYERSAGTRDRYAGENYAEGGQVAFDDDFAEKFKKGSGFADGGQVGMGDVQQAEQQNAIRSAGPQISELPIQQVSPEEARYARIQAVMRDKAPLTANDFTQPGENIPRDAGIVDFARYNVAHFDPTSEENLTNIGMGGMGSIKNVKEAITHGEQVGKNVGAVVDSYMRENPNAIPHALERFKARINNLSVPEGGIKTSQEAAHYGDQVGSAVGALVDSYMAASPKNALKNAQEAYAARTSNIVPNYINNTSSAQLYGDKVGREVGALFDAHVKNKLVNKPGFSNGGRVQHFDVGGTASGLPPDFDNRVEQEKQNLAINQIAMPPQTVDNNNILPVTAAPMDTNQFQTAAETNVAAQDQDQMSRAMESEDAQKALTAQAVQDQNAKIQADNQIRMQAGLPTIPLAPAPSMEQAQISAPVPRENQVSFSAPQAPTLPQDPRTGTNLLGNFDKALGQIQSGMKKSADLQSQAMAENAKNTQAYLDDQKQRAAQYEKERADIQAQNTELYNQVRDSKIDPNRIWNNASTGGKIAASLGLIFGGMGAGMSHQPSQAADFLEKTIQNDIEAQKADQSNKTNLYKLGLEKYRDSKSAEQFASLQASNILAGQIQQTAQKIGSPQALALAQQAIGELHIKYDSVRNDLALKQVALNYGGQSQAQKQASTPKTGVNTGKMNAFLNAGLYDEDTKKALIKEQGEYIKAKNYSDLADDLFNTQTKNANYTNRGLLSHLPSMRDSTKEYDAKTNSFLDKITKDLTGRVTPQSMENLKTSMPVAGDSPEVTLAKRQSIKDIIKTGYEFPTLINKGLLNPNDPYVTSTGNVSSKFTQGAPVLKK